MGSARAAGSVVSLLVIDVDHFKGVNDIHGHLQGDAVLVEVAELLRRNLRGDDMPGRYAGDEFVALLPNTPGDGAREVAERLCAAVRGHAFKLRDRAETIPITISVGVATFPLHGSDSDSLFEAADRALYQVKRQGRDGAASASMVGDETAHVPLSIDRFVGRVDELRFLVRLLEDAEKGKPAVVAVSGEAGVGKSTLLKQLEPEVRLRNGSLVLGRCHEADVQPPYAPWAEIITAIRRISGEPQKAWRELPSIVPSLAQDGQVAPTGGSRYVLLEEIAEYIRRAAEARPLLIVLDDVQWADSASWDMLEYLLPQLENERLLICMTIRAEELEDEGLERRRRLSRSERFRELTLSRLTREEMKQWIEAAFHRQDVGRELLAFLYRHTEGNALFIVQLLRTLVDEGAIWYTGKRWEWRPVSQLRLPVGVSDLISRRLSRLSPRSHDILVTAALIGREFDIDLAIEAGAGSEDELLDAVDEAIKASVLHQSGQRGGDRYAFSHIKLAEVLRESVNPRRLRKIHERLAEAMERRTPDALAEIATHYDRGANTEKAYVYALRAADRAKGVYAHQEEQEFLNIAERNAGSPAQLADVRVRLAEIADATGRYNEAEELCDLAIEWYSSQGDRGRALSLRRKRERLRGLLGQPAQKTLEACLALDREAQELGLMQERVALLALASQTHKRLGDGAAAERLARECAAMAEQLGDPALLGDSLNRLAIAIEQEHPQQATEIYRRALGIYERIKDQRGQARCHNNMGIACSLESRWDDARRELNSAMQLARSAGAPDLLGLAALNLGVMHLKLGEYDTARELFGEALATFAGLKNSERQLYALYNLAHLDRERGEHESAAELYDVALSLVQRIGQSDVEIGAIAGAGLSRLEQGDIEAARAASRDAEERMRARVEWFQGRELVEALRVRIASVDGDALRARQEFDRALALAEPVDLYGAAWLTATCAPELYAHDPDRTRDLVSQYTDRVRDLGYLPLTRRYAEMLGRTR